MGSPALPLERIGLLFCVDAIPAFAAGTLSLKPMEFINLSLPPGIRSKAEHIMLLMLLPSSLAKGPAQKKYYDFAAEFELNDLATKGRCEYMYVINDRDRKFTCLFTGIDGIKVQIFSTSMDTKGREELLGMQSCQSYQGCPVCMHTWSPGKLLGRKQVVCDGYRCFLHRDSAARAKTFTFEGQKYEFRYV